MTYLHFPMSESVCSASVSVDLDALYRRLMYETQLTRYNIAAIQELARNGTPGEQEVARRVLTQRRP